MKFLIFKFFFFITKTKNIQVTKKCRRGKMDVQNQYLDIQLCDKRFINSVATSKYSAVTSDIFIITYFNTSVSKVEYSDIGSISRY